MKFILSLFLVFVTVTAGHADVVRPDERVQNGVTIRAEPTTQSAPLGLLRRGEELPFEGTVPNWNRVRLPNGSLGYVSKSWTTVVGAIAAGAYTVHAVDVGTGLAVIVEGPDFVLVYDGGSNDDLARGTGNRLVAYLRASLPNLQTIDHLILSHPHRDHVELLPDLFGHYTVRNVWDSGALNRICGYRLFLQQIGTRPNVSYHDALGNFGIRQASFAAQTCYGQQLSASTISIPEGARISEAPVQLGASGQMIFLHADGTQRTNFNENSLVVRVDLGSIRVLFMGDGEAGGRHAPTDSPTANSTEGILLACCLAQLRANVLIVGHHGSMTSSRTKLLDAVAATHYVVSSGPTKYGSVTLPDQVIIDELLRRGTVWRTDIDDAACATAQAKIGPDNDGRAGGCSNIRLRIDADGVSGSHWTTAD